MEGEGLKWVGMRVCGSNIRRRAKLKRGGGSGRGREMADGEG